MIVPFSVSDFLDRAVTVYGERTGVVDEPDQPAPSLGELTYAELGALARRMAARLDQLGVGVGERVAVVSHNSARLLDVVLRRRGLRPGPGPGELPAAARRGPLHRRATPAPRCSTSTPSSTRRWPSVEAEHRFVLGDDDALFADEGAEPQPWEPDENATACINYTSGTTARPKGVQITHRNIWVNAVTFGLHAGVTDRDVYLHTLPMFHANGWGMPFAMTGLGVPQIVLRKVDGAEILRRVEQHGVTVMCAAPGGRRGGAGGRAGLGGRDPRPRPGADHHGRGAAADEDRGPGRGGARLGVRADLRAHRDLAAADLQPDPRGVGRPRRRGAGAAADAGGRAGARRTPGGRRRRARCCARSNVVLEGYWDQPEESAPVAARAAGSTPATAA